MLATRKRRIANKKWWPSTLRPQLHRQQSPCLCVCVTRTVKAPFGSFRAGRQAADTDGSVVFPTWRLSAIQFLVYVKVFVSPCTDLMEMREVFSKLVDKWTKRGGWRTAMRKPVTRLPSAGHMRREITLLHVQCSGRIWNLNIHPHDMTFLSSRLACLVDSKSPVLLSSPHMSLDNCQHQQCFVVSSNYRKPQAYKSAGLIVAALKWLYLYMQILINSRKIKLRLFWFYSKLPYLLFDWRKKKERKGCRLNNTGHILSVMTLLSVFKLSFHVLKIHLCYQVHFFCIYFFWICLTKKGAAPPKLHYACIVYNVHTVFFFSVVFM